ncbi:MAG: HNH endonuclease signature motif containing protein [Patescibacteria group bacterium]
MIRKRKWDKERLVALVKESTSVRQVIKGLGLIPAGGNYDQIKKYIEEFDLGTKHFKGKAWNKGLVGLGKPFIPLEKILVKNSTYQSFKLKKRLFMVGLKNPWCEECGWAEKTIDGYLPLELDHKNGNRRDNRLVNLRVLCPNCHSLKPTHRGRNKKSPGW